MLLGSFLRVDFTPHLKFPGVRFVAEAGINLGAAQQSRYCPVEAIFDVLVKC